MLAYVIGRVVAAVPVLAVVAVLVFGLLHLAPGDPAVIMAGDHATPEQVAAIRHQLGLDRSAAEQLTGWVVRLLRGDLGHSVFSQQPVSRLIRHRLEPTLLLAGTTIALAVAIAVPIGILAAYRAGGVLDRLVIGVAVLGFSTPAFVVGYALVYAFALGLGWFPTQGYVPPRQGVLACLHSLALPVATLTLLYVALIARMTRATILEILAQDYIRTARAKGVGTPGVLVRHALRNAAPPIATVVGIGVASLLGGVVVTETVFNVPGLGRLAADAILRRDYPVVQGLIVLFAAVAVVVNLAVDVSYSLFDPRIRY